MDPKAFEAGLESAKPAKVFEDGRKWGDRIKIQQTPTGLLDGNIKVDQIDLRELKGYYSKHSGWRRQRESEA